MRGVSAAGAIKPPASYATYAHNCWAFKQFSYVYVHISTLPSHNIMNNTHQMGSEKSLTWQCEPWYPAAHRQPGSLSQLSTHTPSLEHSPGEHVLADLHPVMIEKHLRENFLKPSMNLIIYHGTYTFFKTVFFIVALHHIFHQDNGLTFFMESDRRNFFRGLTGCNGLWWTTNKALNAQALQLMP